MFRIVPGGFAPEDGNFAAYFGPVGDTATISQNIATTPGDSYSLSFYLANPVGGTPNYFSVTFGNSSFSFTNFGVAFGWQQFTLTTVATSNETPLSFTFRNDPSYWFLDNVTVSAVGRDGSRAGHNCHVRQRHPWHRRHRSPQVSGLSTLPALVRCYAMIRLRLRAQSRSLITLGA